VKALSTAKIFTTRFGGQWSYHRVAGWWECDDGVRYICRVPTGMGLDGEYTGDSCYCMYYFDNSKPPEWVF
jgi:hypothetical protein